MKDFETPKPTDESRDTVPPVSSGASEEVAEEAEERDHLKRMRKNEEKAERGNEQKRGDRLVQSPDLQEVAERLRGTVLKVANFMDGSLHRERAKGTENRIVMVAELEKELSDLNTLIQKERENEMKFTAVDLWGEVNTLSVTPNSIDLRFPLPDNFELYMDLKNAGRPVPGSVSAKQQMYLSIDEQGFSLVEYADDPKKESATASADTFLFFLHASGTTDNLQTSTAMSKLTLGERPEEHWSALVARLKEYGLDVRMIRKDDGDSAREKIYVDTQSAEWRLKGGRYLVFANEKRKNEEEWKNTESRLMKEKPLLFDEAVMQ